MENAAPLTRTARLAPMHRRNNRVLWIVCTILAFVLVVLFFTVWFAPLYIGNAAMAPTLQEGDTVLYNCLSKYFRYFERGDIIVFRHPVTGQTQVKRVIALPGETVRIADGAVILNEKYVLNEGAYVTAVVCEAAETAVPEGFVYVLSDDRVYGDDSRDEGVGLVAVEDVYGVVCVRLTRFAILT